MMDTSNYVQAVYSFKGTNNDELCFKKGQIISVTQREEGGWWEGTLDDKTGWFPSNYVTEYKIQQNNGEVVCNSGTTSPNQLPLPVDLAAQQRLYRGVVVKDLLESEKAHVAELKALVVNFLRPLKSSDILTAEEYARLVGNIEDVLAQHSNLVTAMEEGGAEGGEGVRVGKLFLTSAPAVGECVTNYCDNHPLAVATLETHRDALGSYMESRGAHPPGLLVLTAGLSKPFRRLDKYQGLLQEVLRHLSETDPDRGDTQRAVTVYKEMAANCNTARRQKQLQLEVLSGGVRGWEGEEVSTLGEILHMGSVAVGPSHSDRYLVLFPRTLLVLAVSARMSGFIYQGKLPLSAIQVKKLEDSEVYKNAFEISGPLIETIVAACQTREDQLKWLELIQKQSVLVLQTSSTTSTLAHKEKSLLGSTHQQAVSTMAVVPHHSTNRITSPITQSNISPPPPTSSPPPARAVSVGATPTKAAQQQPSPPPHQTAQKPSPHRGPSTPLLGGWSLSCLRPAPPLKAGLAIGSLVQDQNNQTRGNRRRGGKGSIHLTSSTIEGSHVASFFTLTDERSFEEDAQILGVIEAYCLSSKTRHTLNSSLIDSPQVLIAEEEKIIVEETAGSQTIVEEKSLVDTVYALKDQVKGLASQLTSIATRLDTEEVHRTALQETVNSLLLASSATIKEVQDSKKESSVTNA